ncbi:hypothetical protein HYH02_006113 [Chlamydomonas schloesseri]|uniref:Uncharacterized protein n=1 Tax=Chlamydomonas schloesseri TaxID=2026947 RepID=A0A835WK76_9CHLO|nr:hypothetical protein HYH02_006113 [Chlamydomonas schloesseri]|eukprot:KAG2448759.1 hypothetical protein HYH02_006113 [Chlamydomonas schloesseri]
MRRAVPSSAFATWRLCGGACELLPQQSFELQLLRGIATTRGEAPTARQHATEFYAAVSAAACGRRAAPAAAAAAVAAAPRTEAGDAAALAMTMCPPHSDHKQPVSPRHPGPSITAPVAAAAVELRSGRHCCAQQQRAPLSSVACVHAGSSSCYSHSRLSSSSSSSGGSSSADAADSGPTTTTTTTSAPSRLTGHHHCQPAGSSLHPHPHPHPHQDQQHSAGLASSGGGGGGMSGIAGGGLHGGGMLRSHGPSPGLPLEPAAGSPPPPLQRPDRLAAETVTAAAVARSGGRYETDAYEGDPREVVLRVLRSAAAAGACCRPGASLELWCSDEDEELECLLMVQGQGQAQDSDVAADGEQQQQQQQQQGLGTGLLGVEADGIATERAVDSCLAASAAARHQLSRLPGPELAAQALAVLPRLPPGRVAALAVGLARLGLLGAGEFNAGLVEHVVGRMYRFSPQQLADVAWALATGRVYDLSFLEALAGRLTATAAQWDARSLAQVLWAFGRFSYVLGAGNGGGGGGGGGAQQHGAGAWAAGGGGVDSEAGQPRLAVGAETVAAMVEKLQGELDGGSVAEVVFAAGSLLCGGGGSGCGGGGGRGGGGGSSGSSSSSGAEAHEDWQAGRLQRLVAEFARDNMTAFGPQALGKLAAGLSGLGLRGLGGGQRRRLCAAVAGRAAELAAQLEPEDLCRVVALLSSSGYREDDPAEVEAEAEAHQGRGGGLGGGSSSSSSLRALAVRAEELMATTAAAAAAGACGRHPHMLPASAVLEPGQAEALAEGLRALGVPLRVPVQVPPGVVAPAGPAGAAGGACSPVMYSGSSY